MIECDGFPATIGTLCQIETQEGGHIIAEVIGFQNNNNLLCVHETGARISVGARVTVHDDGYMIPVGDALLGRVFDSLGNTLDGRPAPQMAESWPLDGVKINPLARKPVDSCLDVGVRVINLADRGARPASGHYCRFWCGEICAAEHDDPLYRS